MEDTVLQKVQEHCKSDRYSTQNEFIAKAIMFYCGYLQSEYTGDFLPKILGETLEAVLSMFGDRIGKLLLKQAVEQNICNHIIASDTDSLPRVLRAVPDRSARCDAAARDRKKTRKNIRLTTIHAF